MMRLPEQVKVDIEIWKREPCTELSKGTHGAIVGQLNKICGSDRDRHRVLKYLFGKESTKLLSTEEWWALNKWIDAELIGDAWYPQENLRDEIECILGRKPKDLYEFDRI